MKNFFEYLFSILALIIVGYIMYKHFTSHPSDKYHNDSWRVKRRNKYK